LCAGATLVPPAELLSTEGTADAPPQPVTTLYVGNLPPAVDENVLFQTFRPFGYIPDIQVCVIPWATIAGSSETEKGS